MFFRCCQQIATRNQGNMNSKQKHKKKQKLIDDYGSSCWWCGKVLTSEKLTIDHLRPLSRGGSDDLENLRLTCFSCNNSRGNSLYPPGWHQSKCDLV
jgi:5-methylcytosine-specific restriction endonuclease McrA